MVTLATANISYVANLLVWRTALVPRYYCDNMSNIGAQFKNKKINIQ